MPRDYTKIHAWQLADDLVIEVYRLTRSFPKDELYGLTSQLRRAMVSAAGNIVEGSGRKTDNDYLQFLYVSLSSLKEAEYYLSIAERLGYCKPGTAFKDKLTQALKTIRALINYISNHRRES